MTSTASAKGNGITRVGGVVLAGGQSRRMGTSKLWLPCGKEYLLQRVVRIVGEVVQPVVVATQQGMSLPPLPDEVKPAYDAMEDAGPLAGLAAGFDMLADRCDAALVCACDHPRLSPVFLRRLIEVLGDASAVIPALEGQPYPLTAVYRMDVRHVLAKELAGGNLRAADFAAHCEARIIEGAELAAMDGAVESLTNANDMASYEWIVSDLDD